MKTTIPKVPKVTHDIFIDIVSVLRKVCTEKLNEEYCEITVTLAGKLARKRLSPLLTGKAQTWAAGIIHSIGMVNFLFDKSQKPHVSAGDLAAWFGLSSKTIAAKSKDIRSMFNICSMDPKWTLPSRIAENPLVWMVEFDGYVIDIREAPYEMQVGAFEAGVIPYIPDDHRSTDEGK